MADPESVRILREGVESWRAFREKQHPEAYAVDLRGADLSSAFLPGADLLVADLRDADLSEASLMNATLSVAKLNGANLNGTELVFAQLNNANLHGATLIGADLTNANLTAATLSGADLSRAQLGATVFGQVDLSTTRGLDLARHIGGSVVGTSALVRSKGKIPPEFLRGCGLADWEIENVKLYNPDLTEDERIDIHYEVIRLQVAGPIQINPIFLSYVHTDADTVDQLHDTLQADGIRCWRDKNQLTAGPIEHQVDRAMRVNPTVVLVLSEASVDSDWVRWEAEHARKLEREQPKDQRRRVLCPIALDNAWKDCNWPGKLRTQIEDLYVIPFHELGFDEGYARLKKGLPIYYSGKKQES